MDEGAYADLETLHKQVDEAIAECYGWPKAVAQNEKDIVRRLTELNRQVSEGQRTYKPFN